MKTSADSAELTPQQPQTAQHYYSIAQVASLLGVSTKTVRRRISDGSLPAVRIGRLLRVKAEAINAVGHPVTVART